MNEADKDQRIPLPGLIAAWLVLAAAFDFPAPWALHSAGAGGPPVFIGVVMGVVLGQFAVLCYWSVFGPQPLEVRSVLALVAGLALWALFQVGYATQGFGQTTTWVLRNVALLPVHLLAGQLPLWICKAMRGYSTVRTGEQAPGTQGGDGTARDRLGQADQPPGVASPGLMGGSSSRGRQFGLRESLTATVVVAAALGLAKLGVQGELDEQPSFSDLLPVLIGAAICATASALCIPVVMISAFSVRRLAARLIAIVLCTLLAAVVFTMATRLELQTPPWIEAFLVMLALFGGAISVLYGTLRLLRRQGFVLVRPVPSPPAAAEATAHQP